VVSHGADQGILEAQCDLGFCYANGQGVPQDYAEALKLYRKAAEQGFAEANPISASVMPMVRVFTKMMSKH